jgi:hypothetical protein
MRNLPGNAHLGVKPRKRPGILRERLWEQFDRDYLAQLQIFRAIDFAHSATTGQRHDAVPLSKYLSGHKASTADWI